MIHQKGRREGCNNVDFAKDTGQGGIRQLQCIFYSSSVHILKLVPQFYMVTCNYYTH